MRLTRAETGALVVTLVFVALASGYILAHSSSGADFTITTERQAATPELMTGGDAYTLGAGEAAAGAADTDGAEPMLNINTATAGELTALPGVGEVLAARIVEFREQNGAFEHIRDIMDVHGIGESIFDGLSSMITVG